MLFKDPSLRWYIYHISHLRILLDYFSYIQWHFWISLFFLGFQLLWLNMKTKSKLGKKRAYLAHTSTSYFIIEGSLDRDSNREGTWRQIWCTCPKLYWSLVCKWDLFSLISYKIQDLMVPWAGLVHHQSLIKKMPYIPILWRHFLNWSSLLSDNSSLCQVASTFIMQWVLLILFFRILLCLHIHDYYKLEAPILFRPFQ